MIRSNAILGAASMIQRENLDVRAATLGIDLLDCRGADVVEICRKIRSKINHCAADLVTTREAIGGKHQDGFAAAKFVVFTNRPSDTRFMAGAMHGVNQPEGVINVGVSETGVIAGALERELERRNSGDLGLHDLADLTKRTAFRVTSCDELMGRQAAQELGIPFGVADLSLALSPKVGDIAGEILGILGVDAIGRPGSAAIAALLNDAVKKCGPFASQSVGGLSGASIPVCEDRELANAVDDVLYESSIPRYQEFDRSVVYLWL